MFSIPHSSIPAPDKPYDWSVVTVFFNTYANHLASPGRVYACDTRNSFSGSGQDSRQIEVFKKMLTG